MEHTLTEDHSAPRPVSLRPYFETIRPSLPRKEVEMLGTISGLLEEFLGPEIEVPNRYLLWDLPRRFGTWLAEKGSPENTVKNYTYRLRKSLGLICRDTEDLTGLDSAPEEMPRFEKPDGEVAKRLNLAYCLHRDWRTDHGISFASNSKIIFKNYQKFLLKRADCSNATARLRYGDLRTFWDAKARDWELPVVNLPEMPTNGSPRIGLRKEEWPTLVREQFDWYFRCCRGLETNVPFVVKRRRGNAAENNLKSDISLFLGYLKGVKEIDVGHDNLRALLSREHDVKEFIAWHRESRAQGRAASIHQRVLRDFAAVLDMVWASPLSETYKDWAGQLRVERVRPKFQETIADHGLLLSAVQEALENVERESEDFRIKRMAGATTKQVLDMASRYQDVLMFAIFSLVPLRESNMVGLDIGKSLIQVGLGRYEIRIDSIQYKSKRPFTIQFPSMLVKPLEEFLTKWRPHLNQKADDLLYHTRRGGPLRPKAVNDRTVKLGKELLGVHMNPHHFRMFVASAYLAEHPKDFEQIRQLLGHKFIRTTISEYTHVFCLIASRIAAEFARDTSPGFKALARTIQSFSH